MKKILFTQKSLNEICSSLNSGLVEITDNRNVFITSPQRKGYFIQYWEIDVKQPLSYLLKFKGVIPPDVEFEKVMVETTCYDYIVSTLTQDQHGNPVYTSISLFELVTASKNLLASEINEDLNPLQQWNMDDPIWDCYEFVR